MSTTIDSLDIQITTSAGQAEMKIAALATALGKLKENGKITVATNGLNKLAGALNSLNPALSGLNSAKLASLGETFRGLSSIQKLSGLSSAITTLKKLPDVISKLDDAVLTRFTTQMERLAKALDPLATKINAVASGFSRLPSQVSKAVTATNRMGSAMKTTSEEINTSNLNLMTFMSTMEMFWGYAQQIIQVVSDAIAVAIEWDGIQYRFGRAFGEDAEEVYAHIERINEAMGINIQEFMQYSSLYGSLLSGFGMAQEKVTTISVGLTELSYDIWAAYNDRFKSLEDASEAVRSAITGEIEPIRNAGIALTEASLQEYLDQVGMAHVSIEKLSEAQKAEVRYAAMVNAAMNQGIVGTYAAEMQTAEGAVRSLSQSMKGLTQAFGGLFIPILQKVIPYVTAFVELLTEAVHWVAGLFGIELFKIDWGSSTSGIGGLADGAKDAAAGIGDAAAGADDTTSGLKDAAKAAKKLRDYTMGFDELNVISPPDDSSSGSGGKGGKGGAGGGAGDLGGFGGGLLDLDTLWDDSVFAKAKQQVDELKEKILAWFDEWKTEIAIISAALGVLGLSKLLGHLGEALGLGDKFLNTMKTIGKLATTAIVITLQYSLVNEFLDKFIDGEGFKNYLVAMLVAALGTWVLYSMWGPTGLVIGLGVTAVAAFKAVIDNGGITNAESAVTALTGLAASIGAVAIAWPKMKPVIAGIKEFFQAAKLMAPEVGTFAAYFPKLSSGFASISGAVSKALAPIGTFIAGLSTGAILTIAGIIAAIVSVVVFLKRNWEEVTAAVKKFFETNIVPKLESIKESWQKMKDAVADVLPESVIQWFKDAVDWIGNLIEKIGEWFKSVDWLEGIGKAFEVVGGIIFGVVSGVIAGAISTFVGIVEDAIQFFSGIVQIVSGVIELIVALFTGGDIGKAWDKIWDGVVTTIKGLWGLIVNPIKNFVGGIIDWFTELWDELVGHSIVPDMIDAIVDWFLSLPKKILSPIQTFVENVIKKFKDMWASIKSWYKSNVAPKFTKDYWAKTFDTIRTGLKKKLDEAWTEVKKFFSVTEWKKKVTDAVDTIKKNFKMPKLPKIKLEVTWSTNVGKVKKAVYEALGLSGWPSLKWSSYATGGFPGMGEMFIAREAGPELVGTIGNRSAVVNNDQIVAAVSQGVYSAVVAAMGGQGQNGGQNINVYLDGKQIYASVKKTEAERGRSIMGSQLGYAY